MEKVADSNLSPTVIAICSVTGIKKRERERERERRSMGLMMKVIQVNPEKCWPAQKQCTGDRGGKKEHLTR